MDIFRTTARRIKKHKLLYSFALLLLCIILFFTMRPRVKQTTIDRKYFDRIPVSVDPVSKAAIRDSFSTVGTVQAFREADIFSESEGLVRTVAAAPGDRKEASEALFTIDNELQAALLRKAEARYKQADRDFERYKNLHAEGAVSLSSFEAVQLQREEAQADFTAASRKYSNTRIKAPFSGVVTSRFVEQGELVHEGTKVAHMLDLSKVKIIIFVPERQIMKFQEGTALSVTSDIYPKEQFSGKVNAVSDKAGRDHTYRVEVVMENPSGSRFRSGMFARVIHDGGSERQALLVPRTALVSGIRNPEVFIVHNGKAWLKPLVAGLELQQQIEVVEGLSAADSVVVSGQGELQNGSAVVVINRKEKLSAP
ncbi:MAG: efflux RND transporter periplasmic adaptor subunit [Chlorobiaceae bacterium]|jgi:membrane fusion protein, multidrug efflux system|nr:efflux RND transporter periplasmic adaptor subunit [Chlorobiaceae bacterium]